MKPMRIIIDSREQAPFVFPEGVESVVGTLKTGDYSIEGLTNLVCVERKSLQDMVGCCGQHRERFNNELHRMMGYRAKCVIIEASLKKLSGGNWRGKMTATQVLGAINSWRHKYGINFIYADNPELASQECYRFLHYYHRWLKETLMAVM